jgi:hypothetical protein
MVYQLAHLFGVAGAQYDVVHYTADEAACADSGPRIRIYRPCRAWHQIRQDLGIRAACR